MPAKIISEIVETYRLRMYADQLRHHRKATRFNQAAYGQRVEVMVSLLPSLFLNLKSG